MMFNTGTNIRDYKILSKIGEGGMGSIYLAEDEMLGRKITLKVLNPVLSQDEQLIERFKQEAKVQASLIHPNIVTLHSFFREGTDYVMVMEYAEGKMLKEIIREEGKIDELRSVKILLQILEGLGFAHQRGVVHRDIKPSNIMVDSNSNIKIMDFGIAKVLGDKGLTRTGAKMGTVYYMSPEQIKALKDIDQRTDIYSLGITLYEMLTGKLPYNTTTESDFEVMNEIVNNVIDDPREINPKLSDTIVKVIMKMTGKERERRYKTCYQVSIELYGIEGNKNKYISADKIYGHREVVNSVGLSPEGKTPARGNNNKTVKIGEQIWMLGNLNVDHYRNGDAIPEVEDPAQWGNLKTGAWCYNDNKPENGKKYGKLYNWYAVNDPRGLAPEGWHIPTQAEFKTLGAAVNNNGNALKAIGQGSGDGAGTNTSGFSALLAGLRYGSGHFNFLGIDAVFWSSSEYYIHVAYALYLIGLDSYIFLGNDAKAYGFSVRCVKDYVHH
jgi:uncharacterized protein (TIGR02145 family)